MNVNDLFPSRFLKAHDLGGKSFTLTIRDVTLETVGHGQEQERKLTLAFEKATKQMLLNRTNAMIIASLYGPETDAWKGKAVIVYSARIRAFGAWHDALRIKEQVPARNVGAERMTDAMTEQPPLDDEEDLLDVDEGQGPRSVDPDTGEMASGPQAMAYGPHTIMGSADGNQGDSPADDSLWNTDAPAAAANKGKTVSQTQLTRLHILGSDLYGKTWDQERPRLVEFVTKGAVSSSKELTPDEASILIRGMERKLAEKAKEMVAA